MNDKVANIKEQLSNINAVARLRRACPIIKNQLAEAIKIGVAGCQPAIYGNRTLKFHKGLSLQHFLLVSSPCYQNEGR